MALQLTSTFHSAKPGAYSETMPIMFVDGASGQVTHFHSAKPGAYGETMPIMFVDGASAEMRKMRKMRKSEQTCHVDDACIVLAGKAKESRANQILAKSSMFPPPTC